MDIQFPQRKNPRLEGYNYSQDGMYFVTICTHKRNHLFGHIKNDVMILNTKGKIAHQEIERINSRWDDANVDMFVVMPNHVHMIIMINDVETTFSQFDLKQPPDRQKPVPTLGNIIGNYKAGVTRLMRAIEPELTVWQNRYHDHIIRNEKSLNYIRRYVQYNPALWETDTFYTEEAEYEEKWGDAKCNHPRIL